MNFSYNLQLIQPSLDEITKNTFWKIGAKAFTQYSREYIQINYKKEVKEFCVDFKLSNISPEVLVIKSIDDPEKACKIYYSITLDQFCLYFSNSKKSSKIGFCGPDDLRLLIDLIFNSNVASKIARQFIDNNNKNRGVSHKTSKDELKFSFACQAFSEFFTSSPSELVGKLLDFISEDEYLKSFKQQLNKAYKAIVDSNYPSFNDLTKHYHERMHSHRYNILKELICIYTEKNIIFNPFKDKFELADHSVVKNDPKSNYRLIKLVKKSSINYSIAEVRGLKWCYSTHYLIINDKYVIPGPIASMNRVFGDLSRQMQGLNKLKEADGLVLKPKENVSSGCHIINMTHGHANLGHYIWNDLSGYVAADRILNTIPPSNKVKFIVPDVYSRYADESYTLIFKELLDSCSNITEISSNFDRDSIKELDNVAILPSFQVDHEVQRFLIKKARKPKSMNEELNIFINIRGHNKSLENLKECLLTITESLLEYKHVIFHLEYFSEFKNFATDIANNIESIHERFTCNLLCDLSINDLTNYIGVSHIVIAPVGSGLVIPTWLLNKPCLAHGDPGHLAQLSWWSSMQAMYKPSELNIISFSAKEVVANENKAYSNYKIHTKIFYEKFIKALERANDLYLKTDKNP